MELKAGEALEAARWSVAWYEGTAGYGMLVTGGGERFGKPRTRMAGIMGPGRVVLQGQRVGIACRGAFSRGGDGGLGRSLRRVSVGSAVLGVLDEVRATGPRGAAGGFRGAGIRGFGPIRGPGAAL